MKTRTPSGVSYRVSARRHGLRRWLITVERRQGVTKPTVHTEVLVAFWPRARMRALAAEIAAPRRVPAMPKPRTAGRSQAHV